MASSAIRTGLIMGYATLGRRVRRDDRRRESPSWTIGFEKSSHFGGKKKPGGNPCRPTGAQDSARVRRLGGGDGKQRKIPFVQAFFIVGRQSGVAGSRERPDEALSEKRSLFAFAPDLAGHAYQWRDVFVGGRNRRFLAVEELNVESSPIGHLGRSAQ